MYNCIGWQLITNMIFETYSHINISIFKRKQTEIYLYLITLLF